MSTSIAPKKLMLALCAGEMWATQQVVPVLGDQVEVGLTGHQRARVRELILGGRARARPVQGDAAQVPDPRDSCIPSRSNRPKFTRVTPCVGGVFGDRQIGGIAQDLVEHVVGFAFGRHDHLRAVGGVGVG